MSSIRISYLPGGERDREPKGVDLTWDQLCKALGADGVTPSPCTLETCGKGENEYVWTDKSGKERRGGCKHKYVGAWSPAVYPPGTTRSKKNVGVVSLLVLDLDHMTEEGLLEAAGKLGAYQYLAHSSHSDAKPNAAGAVERAIRVVLPLSEPVLANDWPRFWQTAVEMLGGDADPATCDASRLYFLPTRRADADFLFTTNEGKPLDVRAVLAMAPPAPELPELAGPSGEFGPASSALIERARDRLRRVGPAVEGEGGDRHTYSACCALLYDFALSDAEAWPLLVEWNETCRPPWAHDDLRVKMENAKSYAEGQRGAGRVEFEQTELLREVFGSFDGPITVAAPIAEPDPDEIPIPEEGDVLAILSTVARENAVNPEPVGEPGTWPYELARARRDVAKALTAGLGDDDSAGEQQLFMAARDLLAAPPKPASWLVRRLLTESGVSGIIGAPKTTKSWLAIEVALGVASGQPVLGAYEVPRARPAAYFFAEDHVESVTSRIRAFAAGKGMSPEALAANLHVQPRGKYIDMSKDDDVARVVASCRMIGQLGLVVLDPLRDVHSGKENESDDMSAVFKRLRLIAVLLDCAVLVVHHGKKIPKDGVTTNGDEIRGSSVINGALDARIILRGMTTDIDDKTNLSTFTNNVEAIVKRGRSAGEFQITLTVRDGKDNTAESAVWKHASSRDAGAAAETEKHPEQVADTAQALLEYLQLVEARKERPPSIKTLQKGLGGGQKLIYAAISYAEAKMWARRNERRGVELTDGGRAHLREPASPAEPAPTSIDGLVE